MNPYSGVHFFSFIFLFIKRMGRLVTGSLSYEQLASDEVQVLVLCFVAISSALVGTYLVLRKMAMLANSLSHTILLGIAVAYLLTHNGMFNYSGQLHVSVYFLAALGTGFLTTFFTNVLYRYGRLQEDASTGLVFTTLFALGIILVTVLTRNAHIGAEAVMGNVDALHLDDIRLVASVMAINCIIVVLFYKEYLITTFDPALSQALGISVAVFNYLLMAQVSLTAIAAFRAVGVLMVLAFFTAPPLAARLLSHRLLPMLFIAISIGALAALFGVALSRHILSIYGIPLSTAGIVVCTLTFLFLLCAIGSLFYHRARKLPTLSFRHQRR